MSSAPGGDFERYVRSQGDALYRCAYLLVGDRELAQDILQDVLVSVWHRWDRVSRTEYLNAYVAKALVNQACSLRRRRQRRPELLVATTPEQATPVPASRAGADQVLSALAGLPPRQRAVIVLRYYEDLSEREIADALGCAVGTVKSQAAKAMRTLRTRVDPALLEEIHD
jgi:RNA polymerase sigma-70 factor (sigma-E family)